MPQQTKIFRVFVSSTFTDMKQERRILQQNAFPRLEKFCEENGARFQAVDLRWGINEESALNQKTLQICFNEIARCQKITSKPNFLILLGDKYGWQPIPEVIPEGEMLQIMEILNQNSVEKIEIDGNKITLTDFLNNWYKLDENALPPEFILQPRPRLDLDETKRSEEIKALEYKYWETKETALRSILRNAVSKIKPSFSELQLSRYFDSATHQEINCGALLKTDNEHVLAFSRIIKDLPNDERAKGFIDLIGGNRDNECKRNLECLKLKLKEKLGECHIDQIQISGINGNTNGIKLKAKYITFDGKWQDNKLILNDLQKFNEVVYEALRSVIAEQLAQATDKDEINHEVRLHGEFKTRLTEHFKGRDAILNTIQHYLNNPDEKKVMSLIDASGTGKSSVMAQAVKLNENEGAVLVYRFIGTTSRSSNIMSLLQSICGEIARGFGIEARSIGREGDDKAWYDIYGLSEILKKCLEMATAQKPVLLVLDSLDQLSDSDNAKALNWLPRTLPPNASLIVSSLPELNPALEASYQEELEVMPVEEGKVILNKWLSAVQRTLTKDQNELVINSFSKMQLPIYLKLAFEKALKWHSYDHEHSLKEDVEGMINDYFDDLEKEYPKEFVRTATSYLLSGRYMGLAENEILEILAFDQEYWEIFKTESHEAHQQELQDLKDILEKEGAGQRGYMKIPIAVWSRLYLDLEPFLTERDADGVPIICFFHRKFNDVLREKYKL